MKQEGFEKIERYIRGSSDLDEKKYVESIFLNGEKNLYFRNRLYKDWESFLDDNSRLSEDDLNQVLERIHYILWKNETLKKNRPGQRILRFYKNAAAGLLIPLMIAASLVFNYLPSKKGTLTGQNISSAIYAPIGSRVSFTLPDGTVGMLNSGSRLTYSLPFKDDRHVKLEGEAWFEVTRDEKHPFNINAGNSNVIVLGTKFNISAYPAEDYIEVVLRDGKVELKNNENSETNLILPSERLISRNGNVTKTMVDPEKYIAWTQGKLVFRGDPMNEVVRRLERWYNVSITIADKELEKYSFRATFQDDALDEVLRCLALTSPIGYKKTVRTLLEDGTYEKEKITIYKMNI